MLKKYDIALISDEVITGFGRTGNWFGCETFGFQPDSMSVAKALSSAYLPISAVMLEPARPTTIKAPSTGPSSRMIESATAEPSSDSEPNLVSV